MALLYQMLCQLKHSEKWRKLSAKDILWNSVGFYRSGNGCCTSFTRTNFRWLYSWNHWNRGTYRGVPRRQRNRQTNWRRYRFRYCEFHLAWFRVRLKTLQEGLKTLMIWTSWWSSRSRRNNSITIYVFRSSTVLRTRMVWSPKREMSRSATGNTKRLGLSTEAALHISRKRSSARRRLKMIRLFRTISR